jgi:hypothetical protein
MVAIECVAQTGDVLGEVPLWHPQERLLYWTDLFKPAIHRFDPARRSVESFTSPEKLGAIALRASGGLLIAGRGGLSLFDPATGKLERIVHPEADRSENMLNDGRCDRRGRFWFGSMNKMQERASGRLYRLEGRRCVPSPKTSGFPTASAGVPMTAPCISPTAIFARSLPTDSTSRRAKSVRAANSPPWATSPACPMAPRSTGTGFCGTQCLMDAVSSATPRMDVPTACCPCR